MTSNVAKLYPAGPEPGAVANMVSLVVSRIASLTADGVIGIDAHTPGSPPTSARALTNLADDLRVGAAVLVVFENADAALPIIIGMLDARPANLRQKTELPAARELVSHCAVDGSRVLLDAQREIVLRCGKSSITLRADGKIVLRGREIVSRAEESNRIKGSTVSIN